VSDQHAIVGNSHQRESSKLCSVDTDNNSFHSPRQLLLGIRGMVAYYRLVVHIITLRY
jgi:hypothetical protein